MAPPTKRRRLFWRPSEVVAQAQEPEKNLQPRKRGFAHTVEQIETAPEMKRVEEANARTRDTLIADHERGQQDIVARQVSVDVSLSVAVSLPADSATSSTTVSDAAASSTPSTDTVRSSVPSSAPASSQTIDVAASTIFIPSSTSSSGISSVTSFTAFSAPVITSSSIFSSTSAAKGNATNAENVLISALNGTYSGAALRSGSLSSTIRSNSSYTYSFSSTTQPSSTGDNVLTSLVLTTATISQDGRAASTITTQVGAAGYGGPAAPTSTDASVTSNNSSNNAPPPPGTIAGGVVGGAAGLAVLLLVAMLFLRWYRRRSQAAHQALLPDTAGTYHDSDPTFSRSSPGMAERAGLRPWAAAIPALMRHQERSLGTNSLNASAEPSFQRISGRKLPSAWSAGMEAPPALPVQTSPYQSDSSEHLNPFADTSEGTTPEENALSKQRSNERMTVVPGPQRRPTIHRPSQNLAVGEANPKHMSSMARTSGVVGDFTQGRVSPPT